MRGVTTFWTGYLVLKIYWNTFFLICGMFYNVIPVLKG